MSENRNSRFWMLFVIMLACLWLVTSLFAQEPGPQAEPEVTPPTQGTLQATTPEGKTVECPLKHTSVYAHVAGFLAEVSVRQHFHNPFDEKIEAVYVFPLPEDSAVDEMVMIVGSRDIYGEIHERERARFIYEQARAEGKRTALLEQERPNIFTQSVANIQPGEEIIISIHYVQPLKYDAGTYRYHFPMVVGPRFIPGTPTGKEGAGWAKDTDLVPDASRITPPVLKPGYRTGHDISLEASIEAGVLIEDVRSKSHDVTIDRPDETKARVKLKAADSIPNKDFMLSYRVAGAHPRSALLTHRSQAGGYFMLMLQPSVDNVTKEYEAKELFFVLDCSGSMSGYPIQKSKQAMVHCIRGIGPADTFQIIRFSSSASQFSPKPVASTFENKRKALEYVDGLYGSGGTVMIEGIKAALDYPRDLERQRYVFFMTDGYIGNEDQILAAIKEKLGDARIFSFGIGSSANRHLIEGMGKTGNGVARFVRQDEDPAAVITELFSRLSQPYLTNVEIECEGVELSELYPLPLPDLLQAQPLLLFGVYEGNGLATVTLKGKLNGKPYAEQIEVQFADWQPGNACLASAWARQKIQQLMFDQLGQRKDLSKEVTEIALEFHLMSQYTSFVAVDEEIPEGSGSTLPRTVAVPVPMPEGVSFEGVFGPADLYAGVAVDEEHAGEEMAAAVPSTGAPVSAATARYAMPAGRALRRRPAAGGPRIRLENRQRVAEGNVLALMYQEGELADADYALGGAGGEAPEELKALAEADRELYERFANACYYGDEKATNDALAKLLASDHKGALTAAVVLCEQMAARGQKLSDANEKAVAEMRAAEEADRRSAGLQITLLMAEKPAAALLDDASRDKDARTRLLAAWALGLDPELKAPEALERLLTDEDPSVLAMAAKAAGQVRKDPGHAKRLAEILLAADPEKAGGAVLEAAIGLACIARQDEEARPEAQTALLKALDRQYPDKLAAAVVVACLKGLEGYDKDGGLERFGKFGGKDHELSVRLLAMQRALAYGRAGVLLVHAEVAADPQLSKQPELMVCLARAISGLGFRPWTAEAPPPSGDLASWAFEHLQNEAYAGRQYGLLRVALVEGVMPVLNRERTEHLIGLLRTDRDWRVRRAVLAGLAARGGEEFQRAVDLALEDPHPVIKQIALAGLVAQGASEEARAGHVSRLASLPTVATCTAILKSEGVSPDLAMRPAEEIRKALAARL